MKTLLSLVSASMLAVSSSFSQVPGIPGLSRAPVASVHQGTTLGANTTSRAGGIDLANRVKLSGYVDFMYKNVDDEMVRHDKGFDTSADVDFLFDFSPITAELHTELQPDGVTLEQAFIRYNVNRDVSITMGRQLTILGYEGDEATNLYQVSNAYLFTDDTANGGDNGFRRKYVDGIRANFNNRRFGFSIGLHNTLYRQIPNLDDDTNDGDVAIDIQAAIMILPGLEGRMGYAHESRDSVGNLNADIDQFNAWLEYHDRALTLAVEYDNWDIGTRDIWDVMLMANYQFNDFFGLTLRYSHEDEDGAADTDRFTLCGGFGITDNLKLGLEYSHASVDNGVSDYEVDEFYAESLLSF